MVELLEKALCGARSLLGLERPRPPAQPTGETGTQPPTPAREIVSLSIGSSADDLPTSIACVVCGKLAPRRDVPFEFAFEDHGQPRLARAENAQGYHCDSCDFDFSHARGDLAAFLAAREVVLRAGDRQGLERVQASIDAARHVLALDARFTPAT